MILDILKKINDSGTTVMVITHDNILVDAKKDEARQIHLKEGRVESDTRASSRGTEKHNKEESIGEAMGAEKKVESKGEKKEKKIDPELEKLSKGLLEKFKKNAIYTNDLLLNLKKSDLKKLNLKRKEEKELKRYIKNYLSKKKDATKKKGK
jgi:ABC-type dipeptide/oligopeptide/nickel transport system ATPase component